MGQCCLTSSGGVLFPREWPLCIQAPWQAFLPRTGWLRFVMWATSILGGLILVAQILKNLPAVWEMWVWSLSWEDPLEEGIGNPLVFLPDESHGQRTCPCPMDRGAWCTTVYGVTGWATNTYTWLCTQVNFTNANPTLFLSQWVRMQPFLATQRWTWETICQC